MCERLCTFVYIYRHLVFSLNDSMCKLQVPRRAFDFPLKLLIVAVTIFASKFFCCRSHEAFV